MSKSFHCGERLAAEITYLAQRRGLTEVEYVQEALKLMRLIVETNTKAYVLYDNRNYKTDKVWLKF